MAPINEIVKELGAEHVQTDCFTCPSKTGAKLLYTRHNGYGTGHFPPAYQIEEARQAAKDHDQLHDIRIFIGKG